MNLLLTITVLLLINAATVKAMLWVSRHWGSARSWNEPTPAKWAFIAFGSVLAFITLPALTFTVYVLSFLKWAS